MGTLEEGIDRIWRTIPRTDDAWALASRAAERFGDRVWHDPLAGEGSLRLHLRDPERRGCLAPSPVLAIDMEHQPSPHMNRFAGDEQMNAWIQDDLQRRREGILPPRRAHAARLTLREGEAVVQCTYDADGWLSETMRSTGEPGQPPVLSLLLSEHEGLDGMLDAVLALDPLGAELLRVHMPVPCPGGPPGAWLRVQLALGYDRVLPAEAGWVVFDGYGSEVWAFGSTFEAAIDAWNAQVRHTLPLPPAEPRRDPTEPIPEPYQHTETERDEETGEVTTRTEGVFVIVPRVALPWPDPAPENVPAVAVPVEALPEVPGVWADAGFSPIRLFGDRGEPGWALVRDDGDDGFRLVGGDVVPHLHPDTLEAQLDAADAAHRQRVESRPGWPNPWVSEEYPWMTTCSSWSEADDALEHRSVSANAEQKRPLELVLEEMVVRCRRAPDR